MICVSKMLRGVLKFSRRTPVNEAGASAGGDAAVTTGLAGWSFEPAARMTQTPTMKTATSRKYGR